MGSLLDLKRNYKPEKCTLLEKEKTQWFRDAKFGLFIHWGIYSIPAQGEWELFNHRHNISEYAKYADQFVAEKFNADEWAQMAKDAGMKYMVLTARHHDGFCLFDSKVSDFTSVKTAAKKDFVKEYTEACRKAGLKVGLYYSPMDWRFPGYFFPEMYFDNALKMRDQCTEQLRELMTNYGKIDMLWFDGEWLAHGGTAWEPKKNPEFSQDDIFMNVNYFWESEKVINMIRGLQPDIMINNRFSYEGDFSVRERFVGDIKTDKPWDTNDCLAKSWGWYPGLPMFSLRECIRNLVQIVVRDGNYLLNLGPTGEGNFNSEQAERIRQVGDWLIEYGDTIYSTRGGPILPGDWGGATYHDNKIYLHILEWPDDKLKLTLLDGEVISYRNKTGKEVIISQKGREIEVQVPIPDRNLYDTIIELEMETLIKWEGAVVNSEAKYGLRDGV
jgi:alpha-L-fucosidase